MTNWSDKIIDDALKKYLINPSNEEDIKCHKNDLIFLKVKLFDMKRDSSIKNSIKFLHLLRSYTKWKILSGDNVVTTCDRRQPSFLYVVSLTCQSMAKSNEVSQWVTRKQNNINVSCSIPSMKKGWIMRKYRWLLYYFLRSNELAPYELTAFRVQRGVLMISDGLLALDGIFWFWLSFSWNFFWFEIRMR